MRRFALLLAAGLMVAASPAAAQTWSGTYDSRYGDSGYADHGASGYGQRSDWNAAPSSFHWRSQLDRPGDYRCDAFWDATRNDCGAGWRDPRRRVSYQARSDYRQLARGYGRDGYGDYDYNRYGHDGGYGGHGYSTGNRGYGSSHGKGDAAYHGAYGRPDLVYPAGRNRYGHQASYGSRADWCRTNYRSYDPRSGYYRAWSGRLIYCG